MPTSITASRNNRSRTIGWTLIELLVVIVIIGIIVVGGALYTVREWDQVVITRFGRVIGEAKTEAKTEAGAAEAKQEDAGSED